MISISQKISILCFHSTCITHKPERLNRIKQRVCVQWRMSCCPRRNPAAHLPPGTFHTRRIAGDRNLLRNKCCTTKGNNSTDGGGERDGDGRRRGEKWLNSQGPNKRGARDADPPVSSLCYSCAPSERDASAHPSGTESHGGRPGVRAGEALWVEGGRQRGEKVV